MEKYNVGVITDGELGCNIALKLSSEGYSAVVYNTNIETMDREAIDKYTGVMKSNGIMVTTSSDSLINLLEKPRRVFVVSQSSSYAETILQELMEFLEEKDIIIDTCDSNYKISASRCRAFEKKNVYYMGAGISSTEDDILNGVSIMVGGSFDAYGEIEEMLSDISSMYGAFSCCAYMGPDGAGQYVKMIHNGIEYGILHSISDAISAIKHVTGIDRNQLSEIINEWAIGDNESFLLQAVADILERRSSESEDFISDVVSDKVGYSKSVIWLCSSALELSAPIPSIQGALNTRFVSNAKKERVGISEKLESTTGQIHVINDRKKEFIEDIKNSLFLSSICVYAQAFSILKRASDLYIWGTPLEAVAITFQGGSFIRSRLLNRIIDAYGEKSDIRHLFEDSYFVKEIKRCLPSLKRVINAANECGLPLSVMSESLSYINSIRQSYLDTGIVELARDYIQGSGFELEGLPKKKFSGLWKSYEKEIEIEEVIK